MVNNAYLNKLIDSEYNNFTKWRKSINDYIIIRHTKDELDTKKLWDVTLPCVDSFAKIAKLCIKFGRFKDTWDLDNFQIFLYGPELIIKSVKMECQYKIGLDFSGIYLSTELFYNENIRHMKDEFWKSLLSLYEFKGFVYEEYEFVNNLKRKQFPELFSTNKSMIYRILRKYFFDSTEADGRYYSSSVGELKIQWDTNCDFEYIIRSCCLAFKIMYQLNYSLWQITDLKNKKNGCQPRRI